MLGEQSIEIIRGDCDTKLKIAASAIDYSVWSSVFIFIVGIYWIVLFNKIMNMNCSYRLLNILYTRAYISTNASA